MVGSDKQLVVRQEAAGDQRVVDAVDWFASVVELEELLDADVADDFTRLELDQVVVPHQRFVGPRDNLDAEFPIVLRGKCKHVSVVRLLDLTDLDEGASQSYLPL